MKRDEDALERLLERLEDAPDGLHELGAPAASIPSGCPLPLAELLLRLNGARLFAEQIDLWSADLIRPDAHGRWAIGAIDGDDLSIDERGRVWRHDGDVDDLIIDGTSPVRWLAGAVDACGLLYDAEGEFADDVFDDEGEILDDVIERALRAILRRDARAPGPRWKLARLLRASDRIDEARDQLEQVVADEPSFYWAWHDLAGVSEALGDQAAALDEAHQCADLARDSSKRGYLWAEVARLAQALGDEPRRAEAASVCLQADPDFKTQLLAGVRDQLAQGDRAGARGLLARIRAVAPRDLEVLALDRQLTAHAD